MLEPNMAKEKKAIQKTGSVTTSILLPHVERDEFQREANLRGISLSDVIREYIRIGKRERAKA